MKEGNVYTAAMQTDMILAHIRSFVDLSLEEADKVISLLKFRKYQKGQFVVQAGDVCREQSFVNVGCLKTSRLDENGKEHVVSFAVENWLTGDLGSFIAQTPADYNVQCLENCELIQFPHEIMEKLYVEVPAMERFFRLLIQRAYVAAQRRIIDRMSIPAAENYLNFSQTYPELNRRIPQYLIASYLGITPQFLSQIKRKLAQQDRA